MLIRALVIRDDASPPSCKPFTIHSNVCIGDMIAIIACSIAGIGFFFWAIHAVRKMREDPFEKEKEESITEHGPYQIPSPFDNVQRAGDQTPGPPDHVRTPSSISPNTHYCVCAECSMTNPRTPPLAAGHSRRSPSSRSPGRHGPYGEGMRYGEYRMNDELVSNVNPSHARSSPLHRSSSGFRAKGDPTMTYDAHQVPFSSGFGFT